MYLSHTPHEQAPKPNPNHNPNPNPDLTRTPPTYLHPMYLVCSSLKFAKCKPIYRLRQNFTFSWSARRKL